MPGCDGRHLQLAWREYLLRIREHLRCLCPGWGQRQSTFGLRPLGRGEPGLQALFVLMSLRIAAHADTAPNLPHPIASPMRKYPRVGW